VIEGNPQERIRLQREIIAEKHFEQKDIIAATNAEIDYIRNKISDAQKARKAGKEDEVKKIIDALLERGYSKDFVNEALK
jgi:SOS response regulatory protein OraA/RecX